MKSGSCLLLRKPFKAISNFDASLEITANFLRCVPQL
jgi:hypothetical protein